MRTLSKENKTVAGYIIIGFCLVVFCSLIVSAWALRGEPYDRETLCSEKVSAHTILVLDKTDSLSGDQQKFIINLINKEKDGLETFEKFSIFTLTENSHMNLEAIFSKCNPGMGRNANQLYQNPKKIQERFDEFFSRPLQENIKNVLSENSGSRSPILEVIRKLSFRDDFGDDVEKKTLVIISDMMHHMSKYSHYRNAVDYKMFARRPYAYEVAASLEAVDVKVFYLLRKNSRRIQGENHLLFWERYFEDMGADVVEVRKVL